MGEMFIFRASKAGSARIFFTEAMDEPRVPAAHLGSISGTGFSSGGSGWICHFAISRAAMRRNSNASETASFSSSRGSSAAIFSSALVP
jgi:hypothetical protein